MNLNSLGWMALLVPLMLVLTERSAHAYLDPAIGSLVLQAVAGVLLVIVVAIKIWWQRFKQAFLFVFGMGEKSRPRDDHDDSTE